MWLQSANSSGSSPTVYRAVYGRAPSGLMTSWYDYASKWMFEDKTDANPPRAARAYALLATVYFDAFIASNDGKFAYWYLRPNQLDPEITPVFAVPTVPSYPSNHSTLSTARCEVLAYLFPQHAEFIRAVGKEAGNSRIWAGIHYQIDNAAGAALGKAVAEKFIEHAKERRSGYWQLATSRLAFLVWPAYLRARRRRGSAAPTATFTTTSTSDVSRDWRMPRPGGRAGQGGHHCRDVPTTAAAGQQFGAATGEVISQTSMRQ